MSYKTLINLLKEGSTSINSKEIREALHEIYNDQKPEEVSKILYALYYVNKNQKGYKKDLALNLAVYYLDYLSEKANKLFTNYKNQGVNILTFCRKTIKLGRLAPLLN